MACRDLNIAGLLVKRGATHWGDEPVSALDHALQCAARARAARAVDEVVLAALLHDVGHLLSDAEETPFSHHGLWAARFLRPFVPPRVAWLVEHHVLAKRYLCTVDRAYAESLSLGSTRSWIRQGGVLDLDARREMERQPWLGEALVRVQVKPDRELSDAAGTRDHQGVIAWTEPGPPAESLAGGSGEAARSAGAGGWGGGAECRANPPRVPMLTI